MRKQEGVRLEKLAEKVRQAVPFDWEAELKGLLKAELGRRNLRYPELVERLAHVGVTENEPNIRNKVSRGNFSAIFLLQCLMALQVTDIQLRRFPFAPGLSVEPEKRAWEDDEWGNQ